MKHHHLSMVVTIAAAASLSGSAYAQDASDYPAKPVRITVPQATGGGTHFVAMFFLSLANIKAAYIPYEGAGSAPHDPWAGISGKLSDDGSEPVGGTSEQLRKLIVTETQLWRKMIKEQGIKIEN